MKQKVRTEADVVAGLSAPPPEHDRRRHWFGEEPKTERVEVKMVEVTMKRDAEIYVNGISPSNFTAGETVSLPDHIASALLEDGRAALPVAEKKMDPGAPQNKMEKGPQSNKRGRGGNAK